MSATGSNTRQFIGEVMEEAATLDGIRQIVHDVMGSDQARKVECPECGCEFRARQPDLKKQLDSLIALLEQKEGRAGQAAPDATQVIIQRPAL